MHLPPAYKLALEMFDLAADTRAVRGRVWKILAPLMGDVIKQHEERTKQFAPYYRDLVEKKHERNAELIGKFTERLFTGPFDEAWIKDTKDRVKAERELGYDMRARGVMAHMILSKLTGALARKWWLPKRRCLELADAAARVLVMDAINAAVIHYHVEARKGEARTNQLDSAIVSFAESIEGARQAIDAAVRALDSTSQQLASVADKAAEQVHVGVAAADRAAMNVGQMAAATEELNTSIAAIQQQASLARVRAQEAVSGANSMNDAVHLLSQAIGNVGSVANLIAQIAGQTNLLALNATIEAARAGQHGRGFAVVAAEVKTLASQTADATKHIGDQISFIQQKTQKSIDEIGVTSGKIAEIAAMSAQVESSVEEQAHASTEIATGAGNAARNAVDAANSLKAVVEVVNSTKDNAGQVLSSARQLFESMHKMDEAMNNLLRASQSAGIAKLVDLKKPTIAA